MVNFNLKIDVMEEGFFKNLIFCMIFLQYFRDEGTVIRHHMISLS